MQFYQRSHQEQLTNILHILSIVEITYSSTQVDQIQIVIDNQTLAEYLFLELNLNFNIQFNITN